MANLVAFSEKDQKIRKKWRITWPFVIAVEFLTAALISSDTPNPSELFGFLTLFFIVFNGLLYYFAYRKQGTNFVLMYLFMPLTQGGKRIKELGSIFDNSTREEMIYTLIYLGITLALYGWWYYLNYRLYSMNKGFRPSRACKKKIAEMEKVQSSEELELKYKELVDTHSDFEPAITIAYQKKKCLLQPT